jgi:hypothetical protein
MSDYYIHHPLYLPQADSLKAQTRLPKPEAQLMAGRVHRESLFFPGRETTPGEKHIASSRQYVGNLLLAIYLQIHSD